MEPTYYVSPDGVEQLVSTQTEAFRLKHRGWKPKAQEHTPEPAPEATEAPVVLKPRSKKPKQPKPAA